MVQRRAARFVKNEIVRTSSVTTLLNDLKWTTLQERRNQTKLTMLYKILHGHVDLTPDPHSFQQDQLGVTTKDYVKYGQ